MRQYLSQFNLIRVILLWVLVSMILHHCILSTVFAEEQKTENDPQFWLSPGIPIESGTLLSTTEKPKPGEEEKGWLSRNKWWVALGVVILGGTAAAVAGGGDDGDGDEKGSYHFSW